MPNAAQRLHDLIAAAQSQSAVVSAAWGGVFNTPYETAEFVRRYAELWGLLADTMQIIDALPEASQHRYLKYADAWLRMLATPGGNWISSGMDVSEPALDQLGGLGDLAESLFRGTSLVPAGAPDLTELRTQCEAWLLLIEDVRELSDAIREGLKTQIRHLQWLIDNADTFGVSRVVHEAQATESMLRAQECHMSGERRSGWRERAATFSIAVAVVTGTMTGAITPMLEASTGAVREASELRDALGDLVHPTKEIVDGEIVITELPPSDRR